MSSQKKKVGVDLGLSPEEKHELLRLARTVVETKARGETFTEWPPPTEKLKEARGAFVSIHKLGMLRGCIGNLEGHEPLYRTIAEMAAAAAFKDPRFRPVTEDELPYLDIEISVLTPLEELKDPNEIEVGRHGILIRKGGYSGLLLPQVATERNWDLWTFLGETCRKAGLPKDAWKDKDTKIYVFSADVF